MIGTRGLAAVLAALLLVAPVALAQTDQDGSAAPDPADQPRANDADKGAGATGEADRAPSGGDKSPSDYRASEKISEDLPVSFPVDI